MAVSSDGKKLYVNLTGPKEVGVVELATRKLIANWPIPDAETPNSMVLDEPNHRLFLVTRTPPQFVVMDSENGKQITSLPAVTGADDMFFDAARKRIYVTAREGHIMVYEQKDPDTYSAIKSKFNIGFLNSFNLAYAVRLNPELFNLERLYNKTCLATFPTVTNEIDLLVFKRLKFNLIKHAYLLNNFLD